MKCVAMELYIADHAARVGGAARQEEHVRDRFFSRARCWALPLVPRPPRWVRAAARSAPRDDPCTTCAGGPASLLTHARAARFAAQPPPSPPQDRLLEQITKHDFMAPTIKIRFKKQLSGAQRKQREEEAEADRARAEKEKRDALVADATVSLADVVGQDDAYFEACFGGALLHAVPHDDAGGCLRGARHHFGP